MDIKNNCGCIKNYFDVSISFSDCNHIIIQDQSEWMSDENFIIPTSYDVILKIEGINKSISKTINPGMNVIVSADDFGVSCFDNDILCVSTESCGVKYNKKKALVCNLECKAKGFLANASTYEQFDIANMLLLKIESIKINIEYGRSDLANLLLKAVESQLNKLNCNAHCGCK